MVFHQEKYLALVEYPRYPHVLFQVQVGVEVEVKEGFGEGILVFLRLE
jgi:hypothetical protein